MIARATFWLFASLALLAPSCGVRPASPPSAAPHRAVAAAASSAAAPVHLPRVADLCGAKQVALCRAPCPPLGVAESADALPELAASDQKAYRTCEAHRAACAACLSTLSREGIIE